MLKLSTFNAIVAQLAALDPKTLSPAAWVRAGEKPNEFCFCAVTGIAAACGWKPKVDYFYFNGNISLADGSLADAKDAFAKAIGASSHHDVLVDTDDTYLVVEDVIGAIVDAFDKTNEYDMNLDVEFRPETWTMDDRLSHVVDVLASMIDPAELGVTA